MYGGDVTRKPKPINPTENTLYSPMPMFPYSSPKNPIGIVPYQPKSKLILDQINKLLKRN